MDDDGDGNCTTFDFGNEAWQAQHQFWEMERGEDAGRL